MRARLPLAYLLLAALPAVAAPAKKPARKPAPAKAPAKGPAKGPAKTPAKAPAKPAAPAAKAPEPQNADIGSLAGVLPGNWTVQPPIGQFRLSQYELPKATGDTRPSLFIVFHFAGSGGSTEDNVKRWYSLMRQPDGKDTAEVAKRAEATREGLKITSVDIPGTYLERPFPMSTEFVERPNYRMLAAVIETTGEGGDGPYFLRIVGPAKTVDAAKAGWDALLQSLKVR